LHEPYYAGYIRADLPALLGAAGLPHERTARAYFSKIMVFRRR
jgi:hypothetical protein